MSRRIVHRTAGVILTTVVKHTHNRVICRMPYYLDHNRISRQDWMPFRIEDILDNRAMTKEEEILYLDKKISEFFKILQ